VKAIPSTGVLEIVKDPGGLAAKERASIPRVGLARNETCLNASCDLSDRDGGGAPSANVSNQLLYHQLESNPAQISWKYKPPPSAAQEALLENCLKDAAIPSDALIISLVTGPPLPSVRACRLYMMSDVQDWSWKTTN
jgi:hypothetical protein